MLLCPLCNGLNSPFLLCPNCEEQLEDAGMLENFFEPYRPYLPQSLLYEADGVGMNECLHLFNCPKCSQDLRVAIEKVEF